MLSWMFMARLPAPLSRDAHAIQVPSFRARAKEGASRNDAWWSVSALPHLAGDAAVDHQLDSGDVFRLVRGQKQRRIRDIPGFAHVAHRHLRVAGAPHRLNVARSVARG